MATAISYLLHNIYIYIYIQYVLYLLYGKYTIYWIVFLVTGIVCCTGLLSNPLGKNVYFLGSVVI